MTVSRRRYYVVIGILSTVIVLLFTGVILLWQAEQPTVQTDDVPQKPLRPFLTKQEAVIMPPTEAVDEERILAVDTVLFEYVLVTGGCGPHFEGECLLARSGPGLEYDVVSRLRNDIVLKVDGKVTREDGTVWYKIGFDEWLRYPERIKDDWYVAAQYVEILYDEGDLTTWDNEHTSSRLKKIIVDKSEQKLYAYEDDLVFMEISISTGLELTPTPNGTFSIFKKTPSRYMQGPIPGLADQQMYDLPGVPWNLYFTSGGAVIHGAYWHNSFGSQYSHGCVNLKPADARKLYTWADLDTKVVVKD